MDPRSNVLQKSIYQAIFNVWGAENSFINTEMAISNKTLCLIQRKKPSPVCKYRKRLDFAGLSRHLLSVEAQRLFYCQCFSPGPDAAGGHSDRPGKGKIKKYAKIKKCNYSSGGSKSSSVHLRMICLVRSSGRGTSSSAKYSTFTTSAAE